MARGASAGHALWTYAIICGSLLNIVTTLASFAAFAAGWPLIIVIIVFSRPYPTICSLTQANGVVPNAIPGPAIWAVPARAGVVAWAIAATAF